MSVVAMTKAAVPAMQAQGWGRVLAITSVSVRQPLDMLILVQHRQGRGHWLSQRPWPTRWRPTG